MVAFSSLKVIPNSSSNSGSAFEVPLINLSKASSKSLPKAAEAFLAPTASSSSCLGEKPLATPIAAALAAGNIDERDAREIRRLNEEE